jgi:hypothetical protein
MAEGARGLGRGRYVVGWMLAHREGASLAEQFIGETCARQGIARGQLTIYGPAMTSKPVAFLLADLGVTRRSSTARRPHSASARSRMPGRTAACSFPGTTPNIITPAWACSHRMTCITGWLSSAWRRERLCSLRPMPRIRNDSPPACPDLRRSPGKSGSTRPRSWRLCKRHRRSCRSYLPTRAPSSSLSSIVALWEARRS